MKEPQMTEEQAHLMLSGHGLSQECINSIVNCWGKEGHIIKNPVEEAEEQFQRWANDSNNKCYAVEAYWAFIEKQHLAIIYLQEEIKKLRG